MKSWILAAAAGLMAATSAQAVTVVTADRQLRERVSAVGGACVGPSWLLERTG